MALGRAGARGSVVTLGAQGLRFAAQIISLAILARILAPSDFGLITLVIAVVSVGELFRDFGLSTAAIQANHLTRREKTSLFWLNLYIGIGLSVLVIATAPLFAQLFHEPQLVSLLPITAAAFIINGIQSQFRVELVRSLRFKAIAFSELGGHLSGIAVAIPLALSGCGVWSLVGQQLTAASVISVSRVFLVKWRPSFRFSITPARKFFRTGTQLLISLLFGYAATNADTVTIGLRLDAAQLGVYSRAYQLVAAPVGQLLSPLTNVGLPLLSRTHGDSERYRRYVLSMLLPLAYTSALLFGFIIASSDAIVAILLGKGWEQSGPILALLAAGGIFQFMSHVGYWVFVSSGNASSMVGYSVLTHGLSVICITAGSFFGLTGVALGYALGLMATWPIQILWLRRRVDIPAKKMLLLGLRAVLLSLVCIAAGRLAASWASDPFLSCILVLLTMVFISAAFFLVPLYRQDFRLLITFMRLLRKHEA